MWHWSNFSRSFPKQTAVKSQSCCSPLNTAALTQQPGRLEPMLCWMGYYSQSEAIRGPTTRAQCRDFSGSQKQQPNRWPFEYWMRPHCACFFFLTLPEMTKMQAPVSQRITACLLTNTGTINGTHAQWNTGTNTSPFSVARVGLLLSPCVEFKANSWALSRTSPNQALCQTYCTSPNLRYSF